VRFLRVKSYDITNQDILVPSYFFFLSLGASLVEPVKTQTENAEFSAPKTRVLSKFAVAQNRNRIMKFEMARVKFSDDHSSR
jgi:hypothetical protein